MQPIQITGLFCEDIRAERRGTESIVGVLPERLNLPEFPATLPRLAVYIRIVIDAEEHDFSPIEIKFVGSDIEDTKIIGKIEDSVIQEAVTKAKSDQRPIAGVIARIAMAGFVVNRPGRLLAVLTRQDKSLIAASLYFASVA